VSPLKSSRANIDTIAFNIPGIGPHTIQPTSGLPTITEPVIIDGTTEPDFAGTPIIEIDGSNAGATDGLRLKQMVATSYKEIILVQM